MKWNPLHGGTDKKLPERFYSALRESFFQALKTIELICLQGNGVTHIICPVFSVAAFRLITSFVAKPRITIVKAERK